jgi:hypothetical protein
MSWSSKSYVGPAVEYEFELETDPELLDERTTGFVGEVALHLEGIVRAMGGDRVGVSAAGHLQRSPGPGDSLSISVASLRPEGAD